MKNRRKQLRKVTEIMESAMRAWFGPKLTKAIVFAAFSAAAYSAVFFQVVTNQYSVPLLSAGFLIFPLLFGLAAYWCEKSSTWEQKIYLCLADYQPVDCKAFAILKQNTKNRGTLAYSDLFEWIGLEQAAIEQITSMPAPGSPTAMARDHFVRK